MKLIETLPFEWQVGLRYTRAGRRSARNSFLSFISGISMAGIALGVAALIVVMSVMNGFQTDVRDRMLSILAHIEVIDANGGLRSWQAVAKEAAKHPEVRAAAPYIDAQAMITRDESVRGVLVRGVLPQEESKVSDVASQMRQGRFADLRGGEFNIVLGSELARALKAVPGQKITMLSPQGQVTPAGVLPRIKQYTVVGIFEAGHYEYDSTLAYVHLDDAQKMFRLPGPGGLRLKLADMHRAPQVAQQLPGLITAEVLVRDWTRQNRIWFAAVQTEKRVMFVILALIMAVAAFNLVSTLVMTVTDKHADIAILRTLGATPGSIMKIFIVQGALVGMIGTALGVVLGIVLANNVGAMVSWLEQVLERQFVPRDIYLISVLPCDLRPDDVITIALLALLLAFLATLYPSWSASRVKPAEALRYE